LDGRSPAHPIIPSNPIVISTVLLAIFRIVSFHGLADKPEAHYTNNFITI
jgi:hypothetical protein